MIQWNQELYHYGIPRRSGRYKWGSGKNPYHHGSDGTGGKANKKKEKRELTPEERRARRNRNIKIAAGVGITIGVAIAAKKLYDRRELRSAIDDIRTAKSYTPVKGKSGRVVGEGMVRRAADMSDRASKESTLAGKYYVRVGYRHDLPKPDNRTSKFYIKPSGINTMKPSASGSAASYRTMKRKRVVKRVGVKDDARAKQAYELAKEKQTRASEYAGDINLRARIHGTPKYMGRPNRIERQTKRRRRR